MPTFFRRPKLPPRLLRRRVLVFSSPIAATVGTAAGTSTVTGVGVAITPIVGSAAGIATVTGVSSSIIHQQVIASTIIQFPVDCVLAGQQEEYKKRPLSFKAGNAKGRALRHVFGE